MCQLSSEQRCWSSNSAAFTASLCAQSLLKSLLKNVTAENKIKKLSLVYYKIKGAQRRTLIISSKLITCLSWFLMTKIKGVEGCVYWYLLPWVILGSGNWRTIQWHSGTSLWWCGLWGLVLQNTKCGCLFKPTHRKLGSSVTSAHPHGIHLGHSSGSGLHVRAAKIHLSGGRKYRLLIIQGDGISMCLKGAGVMSICGFYGLFCATGSLAK